MTFVRRVASVLAAVALVGAGALATAPAASAGPASITSCSFDPSIVAVPGPDVDVDTVLTFEGGSAAWAAYYINGEFYFDGFAPILGTSPAVLPVSLDAGMASARLELWATDGSGPIGEGPLCSITIELLPRGPAAVDLDLVQQLPVPSSGDCADIADAAFAWGTGLSGGWTRSWAEWANGPVCTRTLHHGPGGWLIR